MEKGDKLTDLIYIVFRTNVWSIWKQRNYRIFECKIMEKYQTCKEIQSTVKIFMFKSNEKDINYTKYQTIMEAWGIFSFDTLNEVDTRLNVSVEAGNARFQRDGMNCNDDEAVQNEAGGRPIRLFELP